MKKIEVILVVGLITFVVSVFMLIAVACADEPIQQERIIYTKEYVAQYLGDLITVTFINDNGEFNRITIVMEGVIVKYKYHKNGYEKDIGYFITGKSNNAREVLINIIKIRTIQK